MGDACAIMLAALALACVAQAEPAGLRVWVTLQDGAVDAAALTAAGAEAVCLPPALATAPTIARVRAAGLQVLGTVPLEGASAEDLAWSAGLDGLVIASLPASDDAKRPAWEVEAAGAEVGSLEHLLAVKRSGDRFTATLRDLAAATDLPIYLAMLLGDQFPETARQQYLDRHTLLAEGLIDGVLLRGEALDLRRPRLSTTRAILAGLAAPPEPAAAAMTVLRSRDADALLLPPVAEPIAWLQALRASLADIERTEQERAEIASALQAGTLAVAAGCEAGGAADVATIHGVAQSFTLGEPATITAVGLFCTLRGPYALAQDDLRLTMRPDDAGAPGEPVLAECAIPAAAFAEPGFHWGYARLDPPPALEAGRVYWLHAEDTTGGGNSFIWQLAKDGGACPGGQAWSRSYDYANYDWVFRVLTEGRGEQ
jgi:hypothetical protein